MAEKKVKKKKDKFIEDVKTQLVREVDVEGVKVRAYSFGQFLDLTQMLERIYKEVEKRGIFNNGLPEKIGFKELAGIYFAASADMVELITLACPEVSEEDIKTWPIERGLLVLSSIYYMNLDFIKNILALFI